MIQPAKPICCRSSPVSAAGDMSAGPVVRSGTVTPVTMIAGIPAAIASANGIKSVWRSWARGGVAAGP